MGRYMVDLQVNRPDDQIRQIVTDYMAREGFTYTTYKGGGAVEEGRRHDDRSAVYEGEFRQRAGTYGGVAEICASARRVLR